MPDMLLRYKPDPSCPPEVMLKAVAGIVSRLFNRPVSWEAREFDEVNDGHSDYYLVTEVTDNDDELASVAEQVQQEALDVMASMVYPDERVAHWVKRVKGVWGDKQGTYDP